MTDRPTFDPSAPLPGPPEPWAAGDMPSLRAGPPWHMTEMIEAEPALADRLLARSAEASGAAARLGAAVRQAAAAGGAITVVGCGTSEHGALGTAEILREAAGIVGLPSQIGEAGAPVALQAFEAALEPPRGGLVIGISHEGGTAATNRAMAAARDAGARVGLVTVSARSPAGALADADLVVETGEQDQSWCHTVGYLSPLLAAAAVGAHLSGRALDRDAVVGLLRTGLVRANAAESMAAALAGVGPMLVIGSGADRTAARELVLKIEEATWLPSAMRDLETFLHGHLPATGEETGLVLILAESRGRAARITRAREALAAAREVRIRAGAIFAEGAAAAIDTSLTPAGRIVVPEAPALPAAVAALVATATPLQLFTERLARARGTNPDPIRRDDPRYLGAAEVSSGE